MSPRRWAWGAAFVLALLVGAQTAYWHWATGLVETGLRDWSARQRAMGWTVQASAPARWGWPFQAGVRVGGARVAGGLAGEAEGIQWQAESVALRVDLWRPGVLRIQAEGAQVLRLGAGPAVPFSAQRLVLGLPLQPGPSPWADIDVVSLRALAPLSRPDGTVGTETISLGSLAARGEQGAAGLVLRARAEAIDVPEWLAPGLGRTIESAVVQAAVRGPVALAAAPRRAAMAWRDADGRLELQETRLRWGKLDLRADASLRLDAQLQPAGTAKLWISGYAEALDAATAAGALPARNAATAKGMLGLVARPTGPDGAPEVELPLTLRQRTLSVRQFQLARFPVLAWSGN